MVLEVSSINVVLSVEDFWGFFNCDSIIDSLFLGLFFKIII